VRVLLVAATQLELCGRDGLVCGIGPVEAAAATARALALDPPDTVLHVGLAGGRGVTPIALVIGAQAVYSDLSAGIPVVDRARPDAGLLARARAAFPEALVELIGTSARVGGTTGCDVEAMEGFAVLRACELAGVPALEVRVVTNDVDETDRARWRVDDGLAALGAAVPRLLAALRS
jgi:futalosine hydrolase